MIKRQSLGMVHKPGVKPYHKYPPTPQRIRNEEALAQVVQSRIKRSSSKYEEWRYFVAIDCDTEAGAPNTKDLNSDFMVIRHYKQVILCIYSSKEGKAWVKRHPEMVVRAEHRPGHRITHFSQHGRYKQFSNHVLKNRDGQDKTKPNYNPDLDYQQRFLKKWEVEL